MTISEEIVLNLQHRDRILGQIMTEMTDLQTPIFRRKFPIQLRRPKDKTASDTESTIKSGANSAKAKCEEYRKALNAQLDILSSDRKSENIKIMNEECTSQLVHITFIIHLLDAMK